MGGRLSEQSLSLQIVAFPMKRSHDEQEESAKEVVLVTGGTGTVGRGIKELVEKDSKAKGDRRWVFAGSADADLEDLAPTTKLFDSVRPTHVLHLAAVIKGR